MATKPQNTPRGLFAKEAVHITSSSTDAQLTADTSGNLKLNAGLLLSGETSDTITQDATAVKFSAGIALSGQASSRALTQNSTASIIHPVASAIPTTRVVGGVCFVSNSTGKMLAYHSTGTTWLYCNSTSVLA